jgi:hypothetical protein
MEQQQCPICMLFLLPGMNLQDHLDTHPKDMIIKALLSAKTEPKNEMATVFLTTTPFNPPPPPPQTTHIYHQQQQQQQIAKRSPVLLAGTRPSYRWAAIEPASPTFLNNSSSPTSSARRNNDAETAFHCIQQNTEQKNIMIVNTSSTQFSIQQTLPVKKNQHQTQQETTTAIELHPVIIDTSASAPNAISIIPRYTSEKYSGPPPSYESSVTNTTANEKQQQQQQQQQPRVIDLTQTPTAASSSSSSSSSTTTPTKQCGNNNNNNKLTTLVDENRHLMITSATPQKYLEYTQTENGDFMITEKLIENTAASSEEIDNVKFIEIEDDDYNANESGGDGGDNESEVELIEEQNEVKKSLNLVKVISNVKLSSAETLPSSIKDIIQQYNNNNNNNSANDEKENKKEEEEETNNALELIQCTETLNLSREKEDSTTSAATSVIRKANNEADLSPQPSTSSSSSSSTAMSKPINNVVFNSNRLKQKNEIYKQPKKLVLKLKKPLCKIEMGECSSSTMTTAVDETKKEQEDKWPIKEEIIPDDGEEEEKETKEEENEVESSEDPNTAEHFTVTFLDQNDYEPISKITVTPEHHHDTETNQSIMSMDLEPETTTQQIVKHEQIDTDELPIIVKTEINSCSEHSIPNASCSRDSHGPSTSSSSRVNVESGSPINFLYQNDRVRFSPPLSPYVYMKTFSSDDQPKQENENDMSWNNNSNSLATQHSDQNSSCSRYTPSFDDNRSNYTDLDVNIKCSRTDVHIRAPSTDSLNIRTDEKMPARGEISEQESNGEIEPPWHHPVSSITIC